MPLTPEDVQKKTFTPVRLREGYDMGEVDQFLDEVEAELTRLHTEIDELRSRLDDPTAASGMRAERTTEGSAAADDAGEPAPRSVQEASGAAARLLELATTSADQLVGEAQANADEILAAARASAERLESETRARADEAETAARTRLESLDAQTQERRAQLLSDLERDKDSLARELESLRSFEREYRTRLKAYFEAQLHALDASLDTKTPVPAPDPPSSDEEVPRRLRELLGEDA